MGRRLGNPMEALRMARHFDKASQTSSSADGSRPLVTLRHGQTAVIESLHGGACLRSRLAALGFTPGVRIEMLQNQGHGPILVAVRDTRIALGRGEARGIRVRSE